MLTIARSTNEQGLTDVAATTPCRFFKNFTKGSTIESQWSNIPCGAKSVPKTSFASYRILLAAPGKVSGSYTKALQFLWPAGAAVLRWVDEEGEGERGGEGGECREWYYDYLTVGEHFDYVGKSNFTRVIRRLLKDEERLERMGRAARRVATDHLTFAHISARFRAAFAQVAMHASPDDPATPSRLSAAFPEISWCSCSLPQRRPRCFWCKDPL